MFIDGIKNFRVVVEAVVINTVNGLVRKPNPFQSAELRLLKKLGNIFPFFRFSLFSFFLLNYVAIPYKLYY